MRKTTLECSDDDSLASAKLHLGTDLFPTYRFLRKGRREVVERVWKAGAMDMLRCKTWEKMGGGEVDGEAVVLRNTLVVLQNQRCGPGTPTGHSRSSRQDEIEQNNVGRDQRRASLKRKVKDISLNAHM